MCAQRLLIVDGNPGVCEVIRHALEDAGYEIDCVHGGPEALVRLRAARYSLTLVDCRLPGGIRTAEIAEQATLTNTAVVLMSGDLDTVDLFERQPHLSLHKPFRVSALIETVRQALGEPTAA